MYMEMGERGGITSLGARFARTQYIYIYLYVYIIENVARSAGYAQQRVGGKEASSARHTKK